MPDGDRTLLLEAAVYRPDSEGPFPLAIIHHGISGSAAADATWREAMRPAFVAAAGWFIAQGWAVAIPMRRGVGRSQGAYTHGPTACADWTVASSAAAIAQDMAAIVRHFAAQDFVQPDRILVMGHSAGAIGALAMATDPPPGVRAVVNVSGGLLLPSPTGPCGGGFEGLVAAMGPLGAANRLPQLWLYYRNDTLFELALARRMLAAFRAGSRPPVQFFALPPHVSEGHLGFPDGRPYPWANHVREFLATLP